MNNEGESRELKLRRVDISTAALRGAASLFPIVGPFLAEIIGVAIPQQRTDRIAKFAEELDRRLSSIEKDLLEAEKGDDEFVELLEEGLRQATHSLSDERRSYIASLIVSGLTSENIERSESRHLLRILDEINDIEVVWLRFYQHPTIGGDEAFREAHKETLEPAIAYISSPQEDVDKGTLQKSYKEHLSQLGLLERRFKTNPQTELPEYDRFSGTMQVSGYRLTQLGRLLLREIGLGEINYTM